jgi:hypothetical protein
MNANDLADRLEEFYKGTHIQKAAEELRRLYANQTKTLTDEEIDSVSNLLKISYNPVSKEVTLMGVRDFARAILRKAQEK